MRFCSMCGTQIENENAQFCSGCGAPINASITNDAQIYAPQQPVEQYKMKWFKFLVNFALFFGAVINFVYGFNYITGGIYFSQTNGEVTAEMVYSLYGAGMKTIDVIQGILMIATAGFSIYTRSRLAKYKANGPLCVYILYGAGTCLTLLYNIALLAVTGVNSLNASTFASLAISIGFVLLNYAYFAKRKELFVNL